MNRATCYTGYHSVFIADSIFRPPARVSAAMLRLRLQIVSRYHISTGELAALLVTRRYATLLHAQVRSSRQLRSCPAGSQPSGASLALCPSHLRPRLSMAAHGPARDGHLLWASRTSALSPPAASGLRAKSSPFRDSVGGLTDHGSLLGRCASTNPSHQNALTPQAASGHDLRVRCDGRQWHARSRDRNCADDSIVHLLALV